MNRLLVMWRRTLTVIPVPVLVGCEFPGSGSGGDGGSGNTAIVQYQVQDQDSVGVDANRLAGMVIDAAGKGAKLVVTPETAFYRYSPFEQNGVTMVDLAQNHTTIEQQFSALAASLQIYLVIGFREPAGDNMTYNTAVLHGPTGSALARHRKLIPSNDEASYTKAGSETTVASTPIGRIRPAICKDVDDPGVRARYVSAGMDLFVLAAADADGTRLAEIAGVCLAAGCPGVLAQRLIMNGNSAWVSANGDIDYIGGGEEISCRDFPGVD